MTENPSLKDQIEEIRDQLNRRGKSVTDFSADPEILELSQQLDRLINDHMKSKRAGCATTDSQA